MAQQIQTYAITAPGFYGLNSQDSSLDLASGFALTANNCVIDKYGRVGARKGWTAQHPYNAALDGKPLKTISEHVNDDGTSFIMCAGNNKVFMLAGGVLTEVPYGGGGTAPVITDDNWSVSVLEGAAYAFQEGHDPLAFDSAVSATSYRRISELPGYNGTVQQANVSIAAYGRVWNASTASDKTIVQWSDVTHPEKYGSGTAGTLDVSTVWPNGNDTIMALATHNNLLFIFGYDCFLVYEGANNPATMTLKDTVPGIGCIARDSVQYTGTDVIFLSKTGVRSVLRTIQEKSAPFRDLSMNVRDELMAGIISSSSKDIKSIYNPIESFYLLTVPSLKTVYCFDTKKVLPDGSSRVTTWDSIEPSSFCMTRSGEMLIGKVAYAGKYGGYTDNGSSYRFQYFTNHTDLGAPSITSVLKKLSVVVIGGSNQPLVIKWGYDFKENYYSQISQIPAQSVAEYGISEYNISTTEYTDGVTMQTLVAYPTGAGKVVQTGYEADINGYPLSIQKLEIQAKNGKIV